MNLKIIQMNISYVKIKCDLTLGFLGVYGLKFRSIKACKKNYG